MMENDKNPSYGTMKQSHINGSDEVPKVVTGKMLRDNFYTKGETDALPAGKVSRRAVQTETVTAGAATVTLSVDKYHVIGDGTATCDSVVLLLPAVVGRADEFLCVFVCTDEQTTLTLPAGVVLGNGLDFEADRAAGRKFQLSIMDGIALYTYIDPLA